MKSIIEEASTIAKAIEKGWNAAGKPHEFSVKVFEEPEKNFFGFTTKQAKIAIFTNGSYHPRETRSRQEHQTHTQRQPTNPSREIKPKPGNTAAQTQQHNQPSARQDHQPAVITTWTSELTSFVKDWVGVYLKALPNANHSITTHSNGNVLELTLAGPLSTTAEKQQLIFKSIAHLAMEALRNKFKHNVRSLRILVHVR